MRLVVLLSLERPLSHQAQRNFLWLTFPASLAFVWACFLAGFFLFSIHSLLWPLWEFATSWVPC